MVDSWLESFVESYYQSYKKYLVQKNIWFRVEKKEGIRKQANWSDIDILALSDEELILINCKTFLGYKKTEDSAKSIVIWFEEATEFIQNHLIYSKILSKKDFPLIKQLILEIPQKSAEDSITTMNSDIKIIYYKDILVEWIEFLKSKIGSSNGSYKTPSDKVYKKTEDHIERCLMELIRYNLIKIPEDH